MKPKSLRDSKYLEALRAYPCAVTGRFASGDESVVAAHIGVGGVGIKSPDNEVLPMLASVHDECHQRGEIAVLREKMPDRLFRVMLRAYAREHYLWWKARGD